MGKYFFCAVISSIILFCSCSLKYDEPVNSENVTPELQFKNVDYKRYENKKLTTQIKAEVLERYRGDGAAFAKQASFYSWNKKGELTTEGSCALLGIDTNNDIYTLFNSIFLHNIDQNFSLKANNLKWNGKTKQLTSGKEDTVFVMRDDIEIEGTGFSASGISQSFIFENSVVGEINTKDESENDGTGNDATGENGEQ